MSNEYEMTVTVLRKLPEKSKKLAMVKGQLLEEEKKRMTKRSIMKPKVNTRTILDKARCMLLDSNFLNNFG
jgi:hypothetical protein